MRKVFIMRDMMRWGRGVPALAVAVKASIAGINLRSVFRRMTAEITMLLCRLIKLSSGRLVKVCAMKAAILWMNIMFLKSENAEKKICDRADGYQEEKSLSDKAEVNGEWKISKSL